MKSRFIAGAVAAASLVFAAALPALAQKGNPGFAEPGGGKTVPGAPAPADTNHPDRMFVQMAAIGGMSEVELGKLAKQQGGSDEVRALGDRMVQEHGEANDRLARLAEDAELPLPGEVDRKHRETRERLAGLEGDEFDKAYLNAQLGAHQMTTQLLVYEIGSGNHAGLKDYAADTLPGVVAHLDEIQRLQAQLHGAPRTPARTAKTGNADVEGTQARQAGGKNEPRGER